MDQPRRIHLEHESPDWVQHDAIYFVTICAKPSKLNQLCHSDIGSRILETIRHYNVQQRWFCHLGLLMPDHVHLILSFPDIPNYSKVIGDWKRWQTIHHSISWQENFFDHRLRDEENFGQKSEYVLQNPVRAGFVKEAKDWPYTWMPYC